MDRPTAAGSRYHRLKETLVDDRKAKVRGRRARIVGILLMSLWFLVPTLLWEVDLASVAEAEYFRTPTPHEAYRLALPRSSSPEVRSDQLRLARGWEEAALRAIVTPIAIGPSYREIGILPSDSPEALGFQIQVPEGQRLRVAVTGQGDPEGRLFLDLFRNAPPEIVADGEGRSPVPALVRGEEMAEGSWSFDADEAGVYVVRLQPELSGVERYDLAVQVGAPWQFPVEGAGEGDIGSVFGDSRDGGRREHHGVDIFAARGTPVLAASDGYVRSVDTTDIGGRVVWQRDAEGRYSIYYAHLDQILVRDGQRLQAGDTVGLVGNTGNARTTPPHLHFGTYRRGPRDPWSLILPIPPALPSPRYRTVAPDGVWGYVEESAFPFVNAEGR